MTSSAPPAGLLAGWNLQDGCHDIMGIELEGSGVVQHLLEVEAPLALLHLGDEALRLTQALGQLSLQKAEVEAPVTKEFAELRRPR